MKTMAWVCALAVAGLATCGAAGQNDMLRLTVWQHDPQTPGGWFDPNNWTAGVPDRLAFAVIDNGGLATLGTEAITVIAQADSLSLGGNCTGSLEQVGNNLSVVNDLVLGPADTSGAAGWSPGFYSLSYGSMSARNLYVQTGPSPLMGPMPGCVSAFKQSGGQVSLSQAVVAGTGGSINLLGGSFNAGRVQVGLAPASYPAGGSMPVLATQHWLVLGGWRAKLSLTDQLSFGPGSGIQAGCGSTILMNGADFANASVDPVAMAGLDHLRMVVQGPPTMGPMPFWQTYEVAGKDLGMSRAGWWNNFQLQVLQVGGQTPGHLRLVDNVDNQPAWNGPEALYVRKLAIAPGSRIDLNGHHLYYLMGHPDPTVTVVNGTISPLLPGGDLHGGDATLDAGVNVDDLGVLASSYDVIADATWETGDFTNDGIVNVDDLGVLASNYDWVQPGPIGGFIPEPASLLLLTSGLALLRRRRHGR